MYVLHYTHIQIGAVLVNIKDKIGTIGVTQGKMAVVQIMNLRYYDAESATVHDQSFRCPPPCPLSLLIVLPHYELSV